jgi:hypothetical protein
LNELNTFELQVGAIGSEVTKNFYGLLSPKQEKKYMVIEEERRNGQRKRTRKARAIDEFFFHLEP